jgi:cell wall-associated NlpC family hydrolase
MRKLEILSENRGPINALRPSPMGDSQPRPAGRVSRSIRLARRGTGRFSPLEDKGIRGRPTGEGFTSVRFSFRLPPMSRHKSMLIVFSATLFFLGGAGVARSDERAPESGEELSLLERYTNSAQDLILKGLEFVGIDYRRGGTNPDSGFDCSGFVQVVFRDALGKLLPRTAREQSQIGNVVDKNELKPGDLVFFNTMRRAFSHVGIYLGDNRFMHAPRVGSEIRVEDMSQSYWVKRYNGARRIVEW